MKISGIYKIQSKIKPERCYIGSAVNIDYRWKVHLYDFKKNKHHSIKLQRHYNKYGKQDLIFIIVELCFPEFLTAREQYYIDTLNPFFNICKIAGSSLGIKRSEETKQKLSIVRRRRDPHSIETRKKMSSSNIGKHYRVASKKTILKLSESHKGKIPWNKGIKTGLHPKNTFQKGHVPFNKGRKMSEKQKVNSGRKKGFIPWNKGKKLSPESIIKREKTRAINRKLKIA